jgi:cytochrome d ubiquinol oxidase subunit I
MAKPPHAGESESPSIPQRAAGVTPAAALSPAE